MVAGRVRNPSDREILAVILAAGNLQGLAARNENPPARADHHPLRDVYGLAVALNVPAATGGSVICVLMPMFDAQLVAEAIARYRPTVFPGVPAVYLAINQLKNVQQYNLSSIKVCVSGLASLPREVRAEFERLTSTAVLMWTLPQVLAPVVAGPLRLQQEAPNLGYMVIYSLAIVEVALGSAFIWKIRGAR